MTTGIKLEEFARLFAGRGDVYFKLKDSPDLTNRGEIIKSDKVEMCFGYPLLFDLTHLRGSLICFMKETAGLIKYHCQVRVAEFNKTALRTRITLVDAETQIEIEPTEQNAILILEQIAKMEELKSASQEV